jgi:hypothetical protein
MSDQAGRNLLKSHEYDPANPVTLFNLAALLHERGDLPRAQWHVRRLNNSADFGVQLVNPGHQDKVARAYAVQHLFSEGLVYAPDKSWADMVINQCAAFPKAKHDDLGDPATQALKHLRTTGMLQRADEINADLERSMTHHGAEPAALYPI